MLSTIGLISYIWHSLDSFGDSYALYRRYPLSHQIKPLTLCHEIEANDHWSMMLSMRTVETDDEGE